jgi:AcrR family transcriptional regulator
MAPQPTSKKIATIARRVLAQEGSDAVTMRRIASEVGITAMAVYRHYPNRAGLLNVLADEGFAELAEQLQRARLSGSTEKKLEKLMNIFLDYSLENPRLFELMFLEPREGARQFPGDFRAGLSPTANPTANVLQDGMTSDVLREDDVWEIVFEMGALLQGLMMLYLGGRMSLSEREFRGLCRRSFTRYLHGIYK